MNKSKEKTIRVLIAKTGLDGHDRGAKVLTLGLRNEGMETIYTGLRQTPEKIVHTAIQEDVDAIGLSCLSGAHKYLFPRVVELLKEKGVDDVLVIGGGIIPPEDISFLKEKGIEEIFGPGTMVSEVADYIRENIKRKQ
ncbi:MAG: cobalamin B12-binding domain-containing protein [Chloroflexi bacterium]|nr:cobalamin B12-binding domain-containing protein [Chloroflexota bacterium]MBM3172605.1 cobalamin B12-binding domain-containing protein [Chloroflexota bacterium]MBM3174609.1 cobalamin B12-binding domain-containing protein [Chloroflexota bacterium]MBM4449538.1 cobalamin B12-binding domain-containing protein [Chloroflexota bacterium]